MIHFLHQQTDELLGYLDGNEGRTYWDDEQKMEVGGLNVLSFTMPSGIEEAQFADERNRVLVRHELGGWQEYIIYNTVTTDSEIRVVATGSEIEMNKLKVVTPKRHNGMQLAGMLSAGVDGIDWELGNISGSGLRSVEFDKHLGGYDFIRQVANLYGVELTFRVEVSGSSIVGRYIDAEQRTGESRGKEFVAGKDIINIEREMHADRIVTALYCIGPEPQDEEGNETDGERLTTLVTDADAFQRWNRKGQHIIEVYEPQSEDQDMTLAQLKSYGKEELAKRIAAVVEYSIEAADLSALYPHEEAYLADNVRVIDESFVPPLYAEARIIGVSRPVISEDKIPTEKSYTIGEVFVRSKADVTRDFASIARRYSTKIIRQDTPPTGASNVIWIQTGEDLPFDIAHAWDGTQWVPVTPKSAEEIGADPAGSAEAALQTARAEIADVVGRLDDLEDGIGEAFLDGIIEEAEAISIKRYINALNVEKLDTDNGYTQLHGNPALLGTPKTNLFNAKTAYNTAHTALIGAINQAILDGKATPAEIANVDNKFDDYRSALGAYSTAFTVATNAVSAKHAADAKAEAIAAAATDAQTKATAARDAAITAANTKAEAEREIAKAYADGLIDDEEAARIAAIGVALNTAAADAATKAQAAATAAQEYADIAVGEAKTEADAEAVRLADAALDAAKEYADTAAGTAETAAKLHADTKAEAERVLAEAYADGKIDDEEAARIADVNAKLAQAKTYADSAAATALASSKEYADTTAGAAQTAAQTYADTKAEAERVLAEAYADDVIDAEEAARIADVNAKLATAKTYADTAAETALGAAKTYADTAAGNAESAAKDHADAKAVAERVIAEAYADGKVDDEEAARIADVNAKLAAAKTHADNAVATALASAKTYADDAAEAAQTAAEGVSLAEIALAETRAKAHADGIVDDEEAARIAQAAANLTAAQTHATNAANTALSSAKTYADNAASAAENAAKTHADAKAEAERVIAEAYADGIVDDEEEARIAAVTAALTTARNDATTKANTALASAKTYADTAATTARNAAITAANTKAEAEREIAKAYADGIVDDEEEARIADVNAKLAAAKTYADTTAATALASSKTYADTAAANAKTAAQNAANAETALAEARAKAYADGIVDDEEAARIAALTATLNSAKADATSKANAAETAAKTYSDAIRTDLTAAVGDIEDALDLFQGDVNGAFKDGIIQQAEAKSIEKYKNSLDTEKLDFDNRYTKVYADTKLTGTPKTNLLAAKTAYGTAHSNLIASINTAIADGKATAAEATDVNTKFTAYRTALGTLSTRIEEAITATVNKKAADAQAAAITAAATDAQTKATAAKNAAITAANTKAEAEREIAKAYADGIVDDEEAARIAAVTAAANAAALDATSKANAALASSKTYADTTATAAKNAAITAANAKAEAERVLAEAYADGIVDDEEAARIADVNAKLATAKTYADTKKAEAISAAATHANTAATNAKNAAITAANTKAEAEREIAKAYADGIVDAEESARITAVTNALTTAAADAQAKANAAALAAEEYADTVSGEAKEAAEAEAARLAGLAETAAKTYADAMKLALQQDIGTVNTALTNFQTTVTGSFKDGIIQEAEAKAIEKYKNSLAAEKLDVDNRFTRIYADTALAGTPKTNLNSAKTAYNTAHTNLVNSVNAAIADGKATATEKADVDAKFTAYRTALGTLSTRFEEAIKSLTDKKASNAQSAAITAAAADAATKAAAAELAAKNHADAKAVAERVIAEAYADGIVDAEEAARIEEAERVLEEAKLHADAAAEAVVDSENFHNELEKKADAGALGDYATKDEVTALGDYIPDAIQQGIDGIDMSDYATNEALTNTEEELKKSLSATTGLNMVRNSIGYAGLDYWEHTTAAQVVTTLRNEQLSTLGYGSGFYFPASTSAKGIQQTIRVRPGVVHTISWFISKAIAGTFNVEVFENGSLKMTVPDVSVVDGEFDSNYIPYTPETGLVTIRFTASASLEATVSGVMMGLGDLPTQWTLANGELYNAYVRVDDNGLVVLRVDENGDVEGYTNMTPEEFAGYYDENRDGSFERIFYFNRDETVTKKLRAKEEITMGTIKIVRVEGATNRGWAFVPIVRDDS